MFPWAVTPAVLQRTLTHPFGGTGTECCSSSVRARISLFSAFLRTSPVQWKAMSIWFLRSHVSMIHLAWLLTKLYFCLFSFIFFLSWSRQWNKLLSFKLHQQENLYARRLFIKHFCRVPKVPQLLALLVQNNESCWGDQQCDQSSGFRPSTKCASLPGQTEKPAHAPNYQSAEEWLRRIHVQSPLMWEM